MKLCDFREPVGGVSVCKACGRRVVYAGLRIVASCPEGQQHDANEMIQAHVNASYQDTPRPRCFPGEELKKLLAGWPFYITASPDCSCNQVANQMNAWGPDECERPERIEFVLAAMRENAEKRGLPFLDVAGRFLIKRAIKNARKSLIDP